jgi:hypothetical protein
VVLEDSEAKYAPSDGFCQIHRTNVNTTLQQTSSDGKDNVEYGDFPITSQGSVLDVGFLAT